MSDDILPITWNKDVPYMEKLYREAHMSDGYIGCKKCKAAGHKGGEIRGLGSVAFVKGIGCCIKCKICGQEMEWIEELPQMEKDS